MEFFCETGQPLVMYTMDRFMENAGSALGTKISRKNIEEAQEARKPWDHEALQSELLAGGVDNLQVWKRYIELARQADEAGESAPTFEQILTSYRELREKLKELVRDTDEAGESAPTEPHGDKSS